MKQSKTGRKSSSRERRSPPAEDAAAGLRWLTPIIAAGALLIPVVMSLSGEDAFRFPKELALRAEVILIGIVLALAWAFGRAGLPRLDLRAKWLALTALICAWTIVCALVSTNHLVSVPPTVRVLEYAFLFVVTVLVLRPRPTWFAGIIVLPAILNGIIYILQELDIWSPFDTSSASEKHIGRTALIGNPNDVGGYFVVPALVALALALSSRRFRLAWAGAAAFIVVATFMTHRGGDRRAGRSIVRDVSGMAAIVAEDACGVPGAGARRSHPFRSIQAAPRARPAHAQRPAAA